MTQSQWNFLQSMNMSQFYWHASAAWAIAGSESIFYYFSSKLHYSVVSQVTDIDISPIKCSFHNTFPLNFCEFPELSSSAKTTLITQNFMVTAVRISPRKPQHCLSLLEKQCKQKTGPKEPVIRNSPWANKTTSFPGVGAPLL